jgi:menaquinone-dependent protoporphyrinogen oxidase
MSGKVLVAYASAMGGTAGIAEAIGDELRRRGHEVDVRDVSRVESLADYHVVIIGSALYARRWRRTAVRFLRQHAAELRRKQVWSFHSGPLGPDRHTVESPPANVRRLLGRIGAVEPVTFAGRLEAATAKGFLARRLATGELEGDFREWDRIRDWAHAVHDAVTAVDVSTRTRTEQWR